MIEDFLIALDKAWKATQHEPIDLHLFGSGALLLQMRHERGTKDADILELKPLPKSVAKQLKKSAGKHSQLFKRLRMYVVENLHAVQRDYLYISETPIELPEWLE